MHFPVHSGGRQELYLWITLGKPQSWDGDLVLFDHKCDMLSPILLCLSGGEIGRWQHQEALKAMRRVVGRAPHRESEH